MLPVDANPLTPDSNIVMKRSASGDDEPHYRQSKEVPQQQQEEKNVNQDAQMTMASNKGKEAIAQDHDDGTIPRDAKKLKHQEGLIIDINKVLQQDDDLIGSPFACGRKSSLHKLSLEIKKWEMEIDVQMLELEEQRLRWAKACRKKDKELEKMRLENDRMKLKNQHMRVQLKCREWEVSVKSKRV